MIEGGPTGTARGCFDHVFWNLMEALEAADTLALYGRIEGCVFLVLGGLLWVVCEYVVREKWFIVQV
jgi:hypothetical protein